MWLVQRDYVGEHGQKLSVIDTAVKGERYEWIRWHLEQYHNIVLQTAKVLHGNIDQTLVNSLHRLLNFEIGRLDCLVITTEYRTRVEWLHM